MSTRLTPVINPQNQSQLKWLLQQLGPALQSPAIVGKGPNAPVNICVNPSFEDGTYGWALTTANGGAGAFTAVSTAPRFGSFHARLNVSAFDGTDDIVFINTVAEASGAAENVSIPVVANTEYRLSMWARVAAGTGMTSIGAITWTAGGASISAFTSTNTTVGTEWQRITLTFITDLTAAYVSLRISALSLDDFYFDGVQLSGGVDDYPFDHPIHNASTSDNVAVGTLLGFASSTLGANVSITADNTWTDILSVRIPLSANTSTLTALVTINAFLFLDETAGTGDLEVEWRLLRNGVVVRSSGTSVSTADAIVDGTQTLIDTGLTAEEAVVEYRFQFLKDDNAGTWTSEVRTPCAIAVQLFKD